MENLENGGKVKEVRKKPSGEQRKELAAKAVGGGIKGAGEASVRGSDKEAYIQMAKDFTYRDYRGR